MRLYRLLPMGGATGAALLAVFLTAAPAYAASAVAISNFAYSPPTLTVPQGTTVTWTDQDPAPHSVTSDSGAFDSSPSNCSPTVFTGCITPSGGTFSFTFNSAGTFSYHCHVHSFMHGTIVVTAVTTTTAAPGTTAPPTTAPPVTTAGSPPTTAAPGSGSVAAATATTTATTTATSALATTGPTDLVHLGELAAGLALVGGLAVAGATRRRSSRR